MRRAHAPDLFTFTALINACQRANEAELAFEVLKRDPTSPILPPCAASRAEDSTADAGGRGRPLTLKHLAWSSSRGV